MKFYLVSFFALVAASMANPIPGDGGLVARQENNANTGQNGDAGQQDGNAGDNGETPPFNPTNEPVSDNVPVQDAAMAGPDGNIVPYNGKGPEGQGGQAGQEGQGK